MWTCSTVRSSSVPELRPSSRVELDASPAPTIETIPPARQPSPICRAAIAVVVGLIGSLFLLFVLAPVVGLVAAGGREGISALARDAELRGSLTLTALTATIATILG